MLTLTQLQLALDTIRQARALGARMVRYSDGREVEYKSDTDMSNAILDLERQISSVSGVSPLNTVRFTTRKGA